MNIETAYQQALDTLYSYVDYSLTRNLRILQKSLIWGACAR